MKFLEILEMNIGMKSNGETRLFDFDNHSNITKNKCETDLSSSICHPLLELRNAYIDKDMGNMIMDLFPLVSVSLGDFLDIKLWQFSNELTKN